MEALIKDSAIRIDQHLDEIVRQCGKLAVIHSICPHSLTTDHTSLEQQLHTTITTATLRQQDDLLTVQASNTQH